MGQQLASRFAAEQSASSTDAYGVNNQEAAWWCKLLARAAGTFAGAVSLMCGLVTAVTSVISPLCIVGGVLLMLSAVLVLVFEAPVCCSFIELTKPIAAFAEKRTYFQKAAVYLGLAIWCFAVCRSISTLFGCCLIFATGVIYGLMGLGRKADRQHMLAAAASSQLHRSSSGNNSGPMDEASVGLIDNEDLPPLEPFVGQK